MFVRLPNHGAELYVSSFLELSFDFLSELTPSVTFILS